MSQAPAGWYADPSGTSTWRWWDGAAWTNDVSGAATLPPPPAGGAATPVPAPAQPISQQPYGGQPGYTPFGYGQGQAPRQVPMGPTTGWRRNRYALYTFGIVVVYLLIAFSSRIVFIGILPLGMSLNSRRAREPLAPIAVAAAVIALVVGVLSLTR